MPLFSKVRKETEALQSYCVPQAIPEFSLHETPGILRGKEVGKEVGDGITAGLE